MERKPDLSFIDNMRELLALPAVAMDLMAMLNTTTTQTRDVVWKIEHEPALAAYILKYCNSPALGIRTQVNSITHALNLIGFSNTRSILMSYFVRNLYSMSGRKYMTDYLWEHSVTVAVAARELARGLGYHETAEEAYLGGLLHDIGKLALYCHYADGYEPLLQEADRKRIAVLQPEMERFGYTHVDAGFYLGQKWGLSEQLQACIKYHHHPEAFPGDENEVILLTAFANSTIEHAVLKQDTALDFFLAHFAVTEKNYENLVETVYMAIGWPHS